jgi:hypothetical protein
MAKSHAMTPARRAALKKAQAASARKRRGKGKGKLAAANRKASRRRGLSTGQKVAVGVATAGIVLNTARMAHDWHRTSQARARYKMDKEAYHRAASNDAKRQQYRRQMQHHRAKTHGLPRGRSGHGNGSRWMGVVINAA